MQQHHREFQAKGNPKIHRISICTDNLTMGKVKESPFAHDLKSATLGTLGRRMTVSICLTRHSFIMRMIRHPSFHM